MEFGLLTDSHFATQQSQFSRLFIRLFQPLSLAACQLTDNVTLWDRSTEPEPDLLDPLDAAKWHNCLNCPSGHLSRLYKAAVLAVKGRSRHLCSILWELLKSVPLKTYAGSAPQSCVSALPPHATASEYSNVSIVGDIIPSNTSTETFSKQPPWPLHLNTF